MNAPIPLLEVRDFGLEFRTRSGTVHALADINLAIHKGATGGLVARLYGRARVVEVASRPEIDVRDGASRRNGFVISTGRRLGRPAEGPPGERGDRHPGEGELERPRGVQPDRQQPYEQRALVSR